MRDIVNKISKKLLSKENFDKLVKLTILLIAIAVVIEITNLLKPPVIESSCHTETKVVLMNDIKQPVPVEVCE